MTIWIVAKHPKLSSLFGRGHLEYFLVHSTHATRSEAVKVAVDKNSRAVDYFYSVKKISLKETK